MKSEIKSRQKQLDYGPRTNPPSKMIQVIGEF